MLPGFAQDKNFTCHCTSVGFLYIGVSFAAKNLYSRTNEKGWKMQNGKANEKKKKENP